jgi:predicted TIM-barrel fold metal-dependent hydrolase
MSDLLYVDAYTCVGPRTKKHLAHAWRLEDVLAEMDHCSISGALVASTTSVSYDALYSNLELSARLAERRNLWPIWNALPHHTDEFPKPDDLGDLMRKHRVKAITLYPKTNAWDWEADHSAELIGWLAEHRVPTMIERAEIGDYRALDRLLTKFPRLQLLLIKAGWGDQRYLIPLLAKHRNLHISLDHYQCHYGIENLVATGNEDQLVYASNAPLMSMGAHRCNVDYAEVPEKVRAKIAGGNLLRLIGLKDAPALNTNRSEDPIMAAARRGKPLPVPLIDMHMHIVHEGLNGAGLGTRTYRGGPSGVFANIKRLGYVGGGFMSWNGVVSADSLAGNDCVKQTLAAAPQGYWGLGSFDPTHYTQAELRDLIPQLYADQRFVGMKPYWVYGVEYHHPSYDVWWEYGNARNFYALIHRTREDFTEVTALAAKYPNVRWVVAHCGATYPVADQAIEAIRRYPNIFAEITLTPVTFGVIDYLVAQAGEDRVVYGSDLPMRDPRQQLGWVVYSRLPLAVKRKLLGENALKIMQPCLAQLPAANRPGTIAAGAA